MTRHVARFANPALLAAFIALLAISVAVLGPAPALGQGLARKGQIAPEGLYNPKPDQLDLALPMPCQMAMVFRVVGFRLDGKLKDIKVRFGSDSPVDDGSGFLDHRHLVHLGSALSVEHLPPEWRGVVEAALNGASGDQLYLIGKYEVTNAQWSAIMDGQCPAVQADMARPKSDVSWYDVMEFTSKYMEWLLANSPQSLPSYGSDQLAMGVLRLPTEDEWEYAAMDGHATVETELSTSSMFAMDEGKKIADYGLFRRETGNPETQPGAIGRFLPNRLGLYDTVGNVAEMTFSSFRMTVRDRLHGASGGFVRKGGSYTSDSLNVSPGRRLEIPFFRADGPVSQNDLGFRLVLSSANTLGPARMNELMRELAPLLPPPAVLPAKAGLEAPNAFLPVSAEGLDALQIIDALIAATSDPAISARYSAIRGDLGDSRLAEAWQSEAAVRDSCRTLIYIVYTSRNTYNRYQTISANYKGLEGEVNNLKKSLGAKGVSEKDKKLLREDIKNYEGALARMAQEGADYEQTLKFQFEDYLKRLEFLRGYDQQDKQSVNSSMVRLRQDIQGEDLYSQAMLNAYDRVNQDISSIRTGRNDKIVLRNFLGVN